MHILTSETGRLMTISFNRPDSKNAITEQMYADLADAFEQASASVSVQCVLIHGDENIFTAGNDISDFLQRPATDVGSAVFRFLRAIAMCDKPIVASVCGPAVGVGTTMLLHCDVVVCGANATFALPFVNLGLCPEAASSLLLPERVGYLRAAELFFLGEPISADRALQLGLATTVVAASDALSSATNLANRIANQSFQAIVETKKLMKEAHLPFILDTMDREGKIFRELLASDRARESLTTFINKRSRV